MSERKSLNLKILISMIAVVGFMLLAIAIVFIVSMKRVTNTLTQSNEVMTDTTAKKSSESMTLVIRSALLSTVVDKGEIADRILFEFEQAVQTAAYAAESLYDSQDSCAPRPEPSEQHEDTGKPTPQVLYSAEVDLESPEIREELGLLCNLQDTLIALFSGYDSVGSIYFASESGITILVDDTPSNKFDSEGVRLPLEARERPWYKGAKESGEVFLTPVTKDTHSDRLAIMCGIPVYHNGELVGVAGAGMLLNKLEDLVRDLDVGADGNAFIINNSGQVLFSTFEKGIFTASVGGPDLRDSEDKNIRSIAVKAVDMESDIELLDIDGTPSYAAYAPMITPGWSMFMILPQEVVENPTKQLTENLGVISEQASSDADAHIRRSLIYLSLINLLAILLAVLISFLLSKRIVRPITKLTEKVRTLGEGKPVESWDLGSNDETQDLADTFESLTKSLEEYITNLQTVTAEKERIGAELNIATQIQVSMLPNIVPPLSTRDDFGIYAVMDPAREVGGDFYDFFLIDEDHLGLVMADVCGKGVPAALFMMASKIILANNAMMGKSPAKTLEDTNNALCANNRLDMFVTVWFGILELSTGIITAANAGHEYPVVMNPDGKYELIKDDPHGFAVGGFPGEIYEEYQWQLTPGQKLFLYTDGLPEAMTKDRELFGTERMLEVLNRNPEMSPENTLQTMIKAVEEYVGDAEQFDDLTMLCFLYRGTKK